MKLLLTSSGITNNSIRDALVDLLGKPISECNALFIPTAIYPYPGGPNYAYQSIMGRPAAPFTQLGWKSLGVLELSALPSIEKAVWEPDLRQADALLFWGGDPCYLAYWIALSGLKEMLPSLLEKTVYVGVSAGSMAACSTIGEAYTEKTRCNNNALHVEDITLGDLKRTFMLSDGAGLVNFSIIPHFENPSHPDACMPNAENWAKKIPNRVYAIDDQTAVQISGKQVKVISEGKWKLLNV